MIVKVQSLWYYKGNMSEHLNDRDFVDEDGNVRNIADYYDGLDEGNTDVGSDEEAEKSRSFAQGVLFFMDKEADSAPSADDSIHQHHSVQAVAPERLHDIVAELTAAYCIEAERLQRLKKKPNLSPLRRDVLIAAICQHLPQDDTQRLKRAIGISTGADTPQEHTERLRDWRERQFKDD